MAENNSEQFPPPRVTPNYLWVGGLLIFIEGVIVFCWGLSLILFTGGLFFWLRHISTQLVGAIISFVGGFILVYSLKPDVSIYDESREREPKAERREDYYREYQALLDGVHQRGSQIHTVFSILIAGSILALTPLANWFNTKNTIEFPFNTLPLVSLVLIIATISFYVTSTPLDDISWYRINYLEYRLGIEGHHWLRNQAGGFFRIFRGAIWPFLLSALLTAYTFLAIYFIL